MCMHDHQCSVSRACSVQENQAKLYKRVESSADPIRCSRSGGGGPANGVAQTECAEMKVAAANRDG